MREKLNEKYMPSYYRDQLLDELLNHKQGISTVDVYVVKFEELLRSDINEEPRLTVSRFINGLRTEIKREVIVHSPDSLKDAYHKALEFEKYLQSFSRRRAPVTTFDPCLNHHTPPAKVNTGTQPDLPQPTTIAHPTNPSTQNLQIECHPCHAKGHIASRCPHRTLAIVSETEPTLENDNNIVTIVSVENPDCEDELLKTSKMRCVLTTPVQFDTLKRNSTSPIVVLPQKPVDLISLPVILALLTQPRPLLTISTIYMLRLGNKFL